VRPITTPRQTSVNRWRSIILLLISDHRPLCGYFSWGRHWGDYTIVSSCRKWRSTLFRGTERGRFRASRVKRTWTRHQLQTVVAPGRQGVPFCGQHAFPAVHDLSPGSGYHGLRSIQWLSSFPNSCRRRARARTQSIRTAPTLRFIRRATSSWERPSKLRKMMTSR